MLTVVYLGERTERLRISLIGIQMAQFFRENLSLGALAKAHQGIRGTWNAHTHRALVDDINVDVARFPIKPQVGHWEVRLLRVGHSAVDGDCQTIEEPSSREVWSWVARRARHLDGLHGPMRRPRRRATK